MEYVFIHRSWLPLAMMIAATTASAAVRADGYIAGMEPWQRPVEAPVITTFDKDPTWYRIALTGVEAPYPASLRFLEDQGAWYSPFNHPGLTGPYDIRNWHGSASRGAAPSVFGR